MSDDDPLTFQLLFTIPRMASAYARHPDGGARLKIDIEESTVAAANQMLDLMVKRPATVFAAVIVVVIQEGVKESLSDGGSKTDNRAAQRPTDMARRRIQRPTDT